MCTFKQEETPTPTSQKECPNNKFLDSSKVKEFADNMSEFDENGRVLQRVENTVRKGELAHDKQFLFFPKCFQKACSADM